MGKTSRSDEIGNDIAINYNSLLDLKVETNLLLSIALKKTILRSGGSNYISKKRSKYL